MLTLATYPVEEILPMLGLEKRKATFILPNGSSFRIKVGTPRLECLRRNQSCVWCNRTGDVFRLEQCGTDNPHLNLYHTNPNNGRLRLMTQDHILPKSRGGKNNIDNLWTMCKRCNFAKGSRLNLEFVLKMGGR